MAVNVLPALFGAVAGKLLENGPAYARTPATDAPRGHNREANRNLGNMLSSKP